jgi:hypothetical protein
MFVPKEKEVNNLKIKGRSKGGFGGGVVMNSVQ